MFFDGHHILYGGQRKVLPSFFPKEKLVGSNPPRGLENLDGIAPLITSMQVVVKTTIFSHRVQDTHTHTSCCFLFPLTMQKDVPDAQGRIYV